MTVFAIAAMNLFGNLRRGFWLHRHANWEDFPNSMLMLFRMTGDEKWNGVMHECMVRTMCLHLRLILCVISCSNLVMLDSSLNDLSACALRPLLRFPGRQNQVSCIIITDPTLPLYGQWLNYYDPAWYGLKGESQLGANDGQYSNHCSPSP